MKQEQMTQTTTFHFKCGCEVTEENTGWTSHGKKVCKRCENKRKRDSRNRNNKLRRRES